MTLYNCRHSGDQYRITKFDSDMNVESSYLTDGRECDCLAGVRPTCRHREMLPRFLQRQHVGDEWFFDYDRGGWVQGEAHYAEPKTYETMDEFAASLPEGVSMVSLDDPATLHNTIADAVGEPQAKLKPSPFMKRRFL